MAVVGLFKLVGDGLVTVQGGTGLDLLFGQINGDVLFFFIHGGQRIRGNQHLPVREPGSGFCNQIADGPVPVIEVKFFDLPDFPVEAVQFVTFQCFALLNIIILSFFAFRFVRCWRLLRGTARSG